MLGVGLPLAVLCALRRNGILLPAHTWKQHFEAHRVAGYATKRARTAHRGRRRRRSSVRLCICARGTMRHAGPCWSAQRRIAMQPYPSLAPSVRHEAGTISAPSVYFRMRIVAVALAASLLVPAAGVAVWRAGKETPARRSASNSGRILWRGRPTVRSDQPQKEKPLDLTS